MTKLGKNRDEIFQQETDDMQVREKAEKTIFLIRPSERLAIDEFVLRTKRDFREINNSMVVRSLLSVFAELQIPTEGIESEDMLRDRIIDALSSTRISV